MAGVPNIRRVYSRPWQRDTAANPGKVSTGIALGMRPETTLVAHATMLDAPTKRPTASARLAGVGWIDVLNRNHRRLGLVFDKALKLPERPAVQSRPHPLTGSDSVAAPGGYRHRHKPPAALPRPQLGLSRHSDESRQCAAWVIAAW